MRLNKINFLVLPALFFAAILLTSLTYAKLKEFNWKADEISAVSTLATAVIAFLAFSCAIWQVQVTRHEGRRGVANQIYKDYLALAFANPEFSSASYPLENPKFKSIKEGSEDYEKYEFYVSCLLFAAENILEVTQGEEEWKSTLEDQFCYHTLYFETPEFRKYHYYHYTQDIKALIELAKKKYSSST